MNVHQPELTPSGIPLIDSAWGGLYRGGTYLLVGHARAGRMRYALANVRSCIDTGDRCLLISSREQDALIRHAHDVGFDLVAASQQKKVQLMNAPDPDVLSALSDAELADTLNDLSNLAQKYEASRLVVDNFTPFVQFQSFETFAKAFADLLDRAAELRCTFVLGLGEPANPSSRQLLEYLAAEVSGTMRLGLTTTGQVSLAPGMAHHETQDPEDSERSELLSDTSESSSRDTEAEQIKSEDAPFELSIPGLESLPDLDSILGPIPEPELPPIGSPISHTFEEPHGDSSWANITPITPTDAPHIQEPDDPFKHESKRSILSQGHYVDSRGQLTPLTEAEQEDPESTSDLDDIASSIHHAAYPDLFAPVEDRLDKSLSQDAFTTALETAFQNRDETPFVVLALRVAGENDTSPMFPHVVEGVRYGIGADGYLLEEDRKLIALLPNAQPNAGQYVLDTLRSHLQEVAPDHVHTILQQVNALSAPNGEPFKNAADLFKYTFEN